MQCLEPGSEPYEMVSGYPINSENYPTALEALRRRFGSEDILLQVYIRELLGLVISNVQTKEKTPFKSLQMKLDSHLRALKSLNLENADPATWLFPLVESSLPEDILYSWQRHPLSSHDGSQENPPRSRLDNLMTFMEQEVRIRQRIELSKSFTTGRKETKSELEGSKKPTRNVAAVATETRPEGNSCIFCSKRGHKGNECYKAKKMPYPVKMEILKRKALCFNCFEKHLSRNCTTKGLDCENCHGKHYSVICNKPKLSFPSLNESVPKRPRLELPHTSTSVDMSNVTTSGPVFLQTLKVKITCGDKEKEVRAFLDSGSQRSYLLDSTAGELNLKAVGLEPVVHHLFGGTQTQVKHHRKYNIQVTGMEGNYRCQVNVRGQDQICNNVPRSNHSHAQLWSDLKRNNIQISDSGAGSPPIELLIGADLYGKILTSRFVNLQCGVTAVLTKLGWTLMGAIQQPEVNSMAADSIDMVVMNTQLENLWRLDVLGIRDPVETIEVKQAEKIVKQKIINSISRSQDGRYTVELPWKESFPYLPSNRDVALRRLQSTTRTLVGSGTFEFYAELFKQWKAEGIIEEVTAQANTDRMHYIPHRAVIKVSSATTPVRPVFDCSCRVGRSPSLNDCLHKGGNLLLLIPEILLRFRERKIGFVSDIRKAFLMIGVAERDRNLLRFLMWKDSTFQNVIEYRHARLPFGANCSPYILGVILEHHLLHLTDEKREIGKKLLQSMYVDNCVSSVDTIEEYEKFQLEATEILRKAAMDLRLWMSSGGNCDEKDQIISVLGLLWNRKEDILSVDVSKIQTQEKITKRAVLSSVQKVFDPIGFTAPVTLQMKILLQKVWMRKFKWDEVLPAKEAKSFDEWTKDVTSLGQLKIPRIFCCGSGNRDQWELHAFTDASQLAFAAVVFLRDVVDGQVSVRLLGAKSRVAPQKGITIPRLELLGCLIGARLTNSIKLALEIKDIPVFYWSDSTTALAWIRREENWGTFVGNRTMEIRKLSAVADWKFVPGRLNPADLPSRGCSASQLIQLEWWRGPQWLYQPPELWPSEPEVLDEEKIGAEKRKIAAVAMSVVSGIRKQHSFRAIVRITGWVLRFSGNARKSRENRQDGKQLSMSELRRAEAALLYSIQLEAYSGEGANDLKCLEVIQSGEGLLRVETRLTYRKDAYNFKFPIVLPGKHPIVQQLIYDTHRELCHAGVGFLVTFLRKKYWIVHTRRSVKHVVDRCYRCRRLTAKGTVTRTVGLPEDRVRDGDPFMVTGIDYAGPFVLKNQKRVWIVIYTCALYRAIYLDVVDKMTTQAFIKSFGKFIRKYTRPEVVYTDNGTNFHGADNYFKKLEWTKIEKAFGVKPINWKFNVKLGSWWGGWWERLIRSVKDQIHRSLGTGNVLRKEFESVLETITEVINGRPLTHLTEDPNDLEPLMPEMFIRPFGNVRFPEEDCLNADKLRFRLEYVRTLQKELKDRWRKEYLAQLVARPQKITRPLKIGELVVVSSDGRKRCDWDLARIQDLIPGKDGIPRVALVKTRDGVYERPVQRLHPLEMELGKDREEEQGRVRTKAGRLIRAPQRYQA